ncbi:MAG: biotin transporter BioY [Methanomicrobiaceae archaeon]|nr:biotin transporter BioY [Methanomicrobiaceae archaeon]
MFGNVTRTLLLTRSATFIALITAGAWISIPFVPVPLTLQTFFVLLAGAVMKRYAAVPAVCYLLLGALGIPVFHNGLAGIGVLLGPTGGYLLGFVPAAVVVGLAYETNRRAIRAAGIALGSMAILGCGVLWLAGSTPLSISAAFIVGAVPFLPGDALKSAAGYLIAERIE